jgi:hypothetical protein
VQQKDEPRHPADRAAVASAQPSGAAPHTGCRPLVDNRT